MSHDTEAAIAEAVEELMREILSRNSLQVDDLISAVFTATEDLTATFPATPARMMGLGSIPLLSAREIPVPGSTPRCVRVLLHLYTPIPASDLRHVYLRGASGLNDELPV
ncbi:MAG: chorismate mutase [Acidimicrobiales bacterium]